MATTLINREEREVRQAISVAATCPGRHGAAIGKIACMRVERKEAVELMAVIKQAVDPSDIMKVGKIFVKYGNAN